ncbi:MAG: hypothetical protein U0Q19_01865 [Kineosporiaceae bacterium]
MRALGRAAMVLAASTVLGLGLWFVADRVGQPTPRPTIPGIDQPGIVGLQHTVQFLIAGSVLWLILWAVLRAFGVSFGTRSARRRRVAR